MTPILYDSDETNFTSNGIGRLSDAISCKVTEERNGQFELEMEYPLDGSHYSDLKYGRFILATPSYNADPEPFEIYKAVRNLNGKMTFYARHISYRLSLIPTMPFSASTCAEAFTGLKNNAAEECPFTFYTDKAAEGNFSVDVPSSIRSLLGGQTGSILDVFGTGEYKWEKYKVSFLLHRGETKAVSIRYGKNLTDLKQEESIENTITGIVPYWKGNVENQDVTVTLPEKVVYSDNADKFPYKRTTPVDFSSDFQEKPTEEQLRNDAKSYIKNNNIGVPSVNLKVSFVNLADTEEYKGLTDEDIRLCDTVNVVYEKLGITAQAKVIKTVWNVLKDSYDSIELGEGRTNLASSLVTSEKATEQKITNAREEASNRIKSLMSETGHAFIHYNSAGNPFEFIVADDEDLTKAKSLWRWNEGGLAYSSTGYNGQYGEAAITKDGKINANEIQTGILRSYDDNENFYFNLNTGECQAKSLSVKSNHFAMTNNGDATLNTASLISCKFLSSDGDVNSYSTANKNGFFIHWNEGGMDRQGSSFEIWSDSTLGSAQRTTGIHLSRFDAQIGMKYDLPDGSSSTVFLFSKNTGSFYFFKPVDIRSSVDIRGSLNLNGNSINNISSFYNCTFPGVSGDIYTTDLHHLIFANGICTYCN